MTDYNGAKNIINGMYSVIAKSSNFGGELAGRWVRRLEYGIIIIELQYDL